MKFLYLFDQIAFDENGSVCGTDKVSDFQARSNFLYLLSKYNQMLLREKRLPTPAFFKEALSGTMMEVEFGADFNHAKSVVFKNCMKEVQALKGLSDREIISTLSDKMKVTDAKIAEKLEKSENIREQNYIITHFAGNLFDSIDRTIDRGVNDSNRSTLYKNMIAYNSLMSLASQNEHDNSDALIAALSDTVSMVNSGVQV